MGKLIQLKPIEPARHIKPINYAVRSELDDVADQIDEEYKRKNSKKRVRRLQIGDPGKYEHRTPILLKKNILDTLEKEDCLSYGHSMGVPEIRDVIANNSKHIFGVSNQPVTRYDVGIGNGSTELIDFCIAALLNPGEGLLLPDPGYPVYDALVMKYHGIPQFYSLREDDNWALDISELEKKVTKKTKGIVVINPGNPTGRNYRKRNLQKVRKFADEHGLIIFADEVYSYLNYDGKNHRPIATLKGEYPVITFGSLSKNYLSPGLRVGWMVRTDPNNLTQEYWDEAITKLASMRLCSAPLLQHALRPAFEDRITRQHTLLKNGVDTFVYKMKKNAELTYKMLNNKKAGISCSKPEASFYVFPKLELPEGVTDLDFARDLLIHKHIQVNNGSGFGPNGKGHIRVVFLPEYNILKEAYAEIIDFKMNFEENGKLKYAVDRAA
ncbi:aminotransferase class I/II-fold pyridoxal phosphate-dependent enzyme [candidate division KSB1 bacterium]